MSIGACSHVLYQLHAERDRSVAVLAKVAALHAQIEALQGRVPAPNAIWPAPTAAASTQPSMPPELAQQEAGRGTSREGSTP
jgi:hypothetical protein